MKNTNSSKNTGFKIDHSSFVEVTKEADPEDSYSRDSTRTSYTLEGASLSEGNHFDVVGAFEAVAGDSVYIVTAFYSTGDSFGHDEGRGIEFIAAFKSMEKAERCREELLAHADLYTRLNSSWRKNDAAEEKVLLALSEKMAVPLPFKTRTSKGVKKQLLDLKKFESASASYHDENDEVQSIHVPWTGYFESLGSISVDGFVVQPVKSLHAVAKRSMKR